MFIFLVAQFGRSPTSEHKIKQHHQTSYLMNKNQLTNTNGRDCVPLNFNDQIIERTSNSYDVFREHESKLRFSSFRKTRKKKIFVFFLSSSYF